MAMHSMIFVLSVLLALMTSHKADAITCADGVQALVPCELFLMGGGPNQPSSECCASAQTLNSITRSVEDRRILCQCFKNAARSYGISPARAEELPRSVTLTSSSISPQTQIAPRLVDDLVNRRSVGLNGCMEPVIQ